MLKIGCESAIFNRGSSACTCTHTLEVHVECTCAYGHSTITIEILWAKMHRSQGLGTLVMQRDMYTYCRCVVDGGRGQTENVFSEFVVYCQFSNFGIFKPVCHLLPFLGFKVSNYCSRKLTLSPT